jgi:hypothetical protein
VSGRLEWQISEETSLTSVCLKGPINEDADLEPLAAALRDLLQAPVQAPVQALAQGAVQELVQESVQEPVQEPVQGSVQEPVQESVQEPVQEPVQESVQEPVQGSVAASIDNSLQGSLGIRTRLRLELSGISRINSCGVREWVNFMRSLPPECEVELDRCPPSVVAQLNMISNFAGSARILSVQAPYVCEACGNEENVLLTVTPGVSPEIGARRCRSCGGEMEFDDIQDSYFAFLT